MDMDSPLRTFLLSTCRINYVTCSCLSALNNISKCAATLLLCVFVIGCANTGHVRINERFPVGKPGNLSPPIVDKPIHECAGAVHVRGFAPGALVEIWVGQAELVGTAIPDFGFADITLTRALALGESITATQTVNNVKSDYSSIPALVTAWGPALNRPTVVPEIWECGRIVSVNDLVPSTRVKIFEDGTPRGQAESPQGYKSVFTNAKLTANKPVTAQQLACEDSPAKTISSPLSLPLQVNPSPGVNFTAPELIADTLIVGNDAITLTGLYQGAHVKIYDQSVSIGDGWATGTSNWVPLSTPLKANSVISATQALCDVSPESDKLTPSTVLPAPTIVGPLCDDDQVVRIDGAILNATVVVLQLGEVVAFGGASPGGETTLGLGTALIPGKPVTAIQYMGNTVSSSSSTVDVCRCSAASKRDITAEQLTTHSPVYCPVTTKPLFSAGSNDVMELELQADWSKINDPSLNSLTTKHLSTSSGTLRYVNSNGTTVSLNVTVNGRGKSRFDFCAFRPLKIDFGSTQSGNIFAGHKKVKLVTHCGNHPVNSWILGGSPEVQRNRLLSEYYFYEVLEQLDTSALSTRLARITYKNPDGSVHLTEYAFWREREDDACQRCGWEDESDDNDIPGLSPDSKSVFQTDMVEYFVYNNDYAATQGHNAIVCEDNANNGFYIPYDWDLTGVVRPEYSKNNGISYKQNSQNYANWLGGTTPPIRTRVQGWNIVDQASDMRTILDNSLLQPAGRKHMLGWFDQYIRVLRCYLAN